MVFRSIALAVLTVGAAGAGAVPAVAAGKTSPDAARLVHGPVVARLTGFAAQPVYSPLRSYRYALMFRLSSDPLVRAPDGGTATRGTYKLDGVEVADLQRLGRSARLCFVGYLISDGSLSRLDQRPLGSRVATTLRPSRAATMDGQTLFAPAQRRRATLRRFDVGLRGRAAEDSIERLGCR